DDCVCPGGREWASVASKADSQEARVNRLAGRVEALAENLRAGGDRLSHYKSEFRELEFRVDELEGNGCEPRHFQCGGSAMECISDLLTCDGSPDCANGADEDSDVCHIPPIAGTLLVGHLNTDHDFCTKRKPNEFDLFISSVQRSSYFQSRLKVKGNLQIKYTAEGRDQEDVLQVKGYYNFGTHQLVILPPEDDRLGIVCNFRAGNDDRCRAHIVHEASLEHCGDDFVFVKEDDHH
uniref:Giant extracellular hemoglobin linker 2 chain n=1 Tax=Tylorrhynchus heterochetus TaxID=3228785 RepID=GLBM_TYLHE|nr:RecName: Full=Giant extracellular hemoglobin linker 2 chain [Tylorrhynchus heterochaetus]